jgi:hypothetical protein
MKTKSIFPMRILRFSGILLFLAVISLCVEAGNPPKSSYDVNIRLNPACKLKRMSTGEVIVFAKDKEGADVKHQFTDFYADLLMAAFRKQRIDYIVDTFSKKYYLSEDDCRREIKHAVNVLSEWNILLREEQIAAR